MYKTKDILYGLKKRLNKDNKVITQSSYGFCYLAGFTFNEPISNKDIDDFCAKTGWVIPNEYKDFLLLHNGVKLFTHESESLIELYKLDEIVSNNTYDPSMSDSYIIGHYQDLGCIMINSTRCKECRTDYLWLGSVDLIDFKCDFTTWLDRAIMTQGNNYWEWRSKIINLY